MTRTISISYKAIVVAAALCFLPLAAGAQQVANAGGAKSGASANTPRGADGHPILSGLWNAPAMAGGGAGAAPVDRAAYGAVGIDPNILLARHTDGREGDAALINFERDNTLLRRMGMNKPQYKPQYWETVKHLDQDGNEEDPAGRCMPAGVPRMGPPIQIMEQGNMMILLYPSGAASPATYRVVPIDGRPHTNIEDLDGTWNGEGIGHWEGDTMVIDTIGFNTATWLDISGYFHSENMHVVERLTRDGNAMTWQTTVEDPDVFIKPWVMDPRVIHLNPNPTAVLPESPPCSERDYAHVVTKEHH